MKEYDILFQGPMIRGILNAPRPGVSFQVEKTQTRRTVKDEALKLLREGFTPEYVADPANGLSPKGYLGDDMWVRETYGIMIGSRQVVFRADGGWATAPNFRDMLEKKAWKPSIFCGREISRLTLEHTAQPRIERVQDISEDDAKAEGVTYHDGNGIGHSGFRHDENHGFVYETAKLSYAALWNSINKKEGPTWADNPWVWVYQFRVKECRKSPLYLPPL